MIFLKNTATYITVLISLFLYIESANIKTFTITPDLDNTTAQYNEITKLALNRWKSAEKLLHKRTTKAIREFLLFTTGANAPPDLTRRCLNDIIYVTRGLMTMKFWAYRMLDASSRFPAGVLEGTIANFGNYDSCLKIDVKNRFKGKFCGVRISPVKLNESMAKSVNFDDYLDLNKKIDDVDSLLKQFMRMIHPYYAFFTFRFEICLPSTCSKNDMELLVEKAIQYAGLEWEASAVECASRDDKTAPFNGYELSAIISMSFVVVIAAVGTFLELIMSRLPESTKQKLNSYLITKILLCFSFITNTRRLLKKDRNPDSIKLFHSMKTFTILWVMLNHTYNNLRPEMLSSSFNIRNIFTSVGFQVVLNGYPSVDTFFFISGAILVYGRMRSGTSAFSAPIYIFRRIFRLVPGVLFITLAFFILLRVGDGPIWAEYSTAHGEACRKYWWTNILFINNMIESKKMCLGWLWYVGADMQLYILALVVLIPIKKKTRLGLWILAIYTALSIVAIIVNQIVYDLPPTIVLTSFTDPLKVFFLTEKQYYPFYVHSITWCIGMATGYLMYWKPKFHVPVAINILGWVLSLSSGVSIIYGVYKWNVAVRPTFTESIIYAPLSKIAWSLSLAWVTLICSSGNGGIIARFLSANFFVPFSRLTYSTFLVHMFVQFYFLLCTRIPISAHHRVLAFLYVSFVVFAFILAFIFSQLFEAPFMNLDKIIFSQRLIQAPSKPNGTINGHQAIEDNNVNNALDYGEKGMYVADTNKSNLEFKSEINSSSL